jgi:hypothetical protein
MACGAVGVESAARLIQELRAALKKPEELPSRQPQRRRRASVGTRSAATQRRAGSWKATRRLEAESPAPQTPSRVTPTEP